MKEPPRARARGQGDAVVSIESRPALEVAPVKQPGGQNRSTLHLGGVCHNVTLQILGTGEYIVKDGVWQL